jgi:hypothetical protein
MPCGIKIIDQYTDLPISTAKKWRLRHPEQVRERHTDFMRNYRPKHRIQMRKYDREWWNKFRKQAITALGNKCVICGFSDWRGLCVDHINGKGNEEFRKIGNKAIYRKVIKDQTGYQCLCATHNQIKRYENHEGII